MGPTCQFWRQISDFGLRTLYVLFNDCKKVVNETGESKKFSVTRNFTVQIIV